MAELLYQTNPRLAELDAARAAETAAGEGGESTAPATPEAAPPEAAAAPEPEITPAPEPPAPDPNKIVFDRGNGLYGQLAQFADTDPEGRHLLQTLVGRKARQQYEPTILELRTQLAEAQAKVREHELGALDEAEIQKRYYEDPAFRQLVESRPGDPAAIARQAAAQGAIADVIDQVAPYLPENVVASEMARLQNGAFDRDGERVLAPEQSLIRFQQHMMRLASQFAEQNARRTAPPAQTQTPPPPPPATAAAPVLAPAVPNPALAAAGPDVSAPSVPPSGGVALRMSEIRAMNPQQRYKLHPNQGDLERDIAAGKVLMDVPASG